MPNEDSHEHDWTWQQTKRLGPANGGPEEMYCCRVCLKFAYASEIGNPVLGAE